MSSDDTNVFKEFAAIFQKSHAYGSKAHMYLIRTKYPCRIFHRKTFNPVKELLHPSPPLDYTFTFFHHKTFNPVKELPHPSPLEPVPVRFTE